MSITTDNTGRTLKVLQIIRDGGGTAPVELALAGKLRNRGHQVRVFGPPEVRQDTEAAGFHLEVLDWPSELGPRDPEDLIRRMIGAGVAWARRLAPQLTSTNADVVVADCAAFGALMAARISGLPTAAIMPTVYIAGQNTREGPRGDWSKALAGINHARTALGLSDVASVTDQILDAERLLVLTSRAFELPEIQPPHHVHYAGPQLREPPENAPPLQLPEGDDPLILVSLSTTDQGQFGLLERLLTAIGRLAVRALVTLGPTIAAGRLHPPANAVLATFVPHSMVLPHASLVVTHAGHGTVMAALSAGVPLVCVPMGRDQPAVAARVTHHGLGVSVEPDTSVEDLRSAITQVLDVPAYRKAARQLAETIEPADLAVDTVEALATSGGAQARVGSRIRQQGRFRKPAGPPKPITTPDNSIPTHGNAEPPPPSR